MVFFITKGMGNLGPWIACKGSRDAYDFSIRYTDNCILITEEEYKLFRECKWILD